MRVLPRIRAHCSPASTSAWAAFVVAWLATLLATPFTAGDDFLTATEMGVILHAGAAVAALSCTWSARRIVVSALVLAAITWAVEALGAATGYPFGSYSYTDALQPQLLGVPLLIPVAWLMMLAPSWGIADAIVGRDSGVGSLKQRLVFSAVAGAAIAAWDLYLDPQMVMFGLWTWHVDGLYFGVPLTNFLGWWATGAIVTFVLAPDRLPRTPLLAIYALTWIMEAVGLGVMWSRPLPAAFGLVGMGLFFFLAWRKERATWRRSGSS